MDEEELVARAVGGRQRGRHVGELGVRAGPLDHRVVEAPVRRLVLVDDVGRRARIDANVPVAEMNGQVGERAERETAGHGAAATFAEAISDEHDVPGLAEGFRQVGLHEARYEGLLLPAEPDDEVVIGVEGPHLPAVRPPGELHLDERRQRLELVGTKDGRERAAPRPTVVI